MMKILCITSKIHKLLFMKSFFEDFFRCIAQKQLRLLPMSSKNLASECFAWILFSRYLSQNLLTWKKAIQKTKLHQLSFYIFFPNINPALLWDISRLTFH